MLLSVYGGATLPDNRLAVTAQTAVSGSAGWQTIDLITPVSVSSGTKIWLGWVFESSPGVRYQTGSPGRAQSGASWSGGMPDPFGSSAQAAYIYSIYATYTTGISSEVVWHPNLVDAAYVGNDSTLWLTLDNGNSFTSW